MHTVYVGDHELMFWMPEGATLNGLLILQMTLCDSSNGLSW